MPLPISVRHPSQKFVVAVIYVCGMVMSSLDSTIVNVALATLSREFKVPPTKIEAVVIGYLVSLAVFIPASGWMGDRWGTKRTFLFALGLFTTASALCGLAQSLDQLVAFRVLQGAGGGLLTPVGLAMLYRAFPPKERVAMSRILMFALIVGPAAGPVLGGLLIQQRSWRWAFYVNVPVGLLALLFGLVFLHEHKEPATGAFDLPGFLLAGSGLALTMYALSEGPSRPFPSAPVIATGAAGLVLLTLFVAVELRAPHPMVQLRLLQNRLFRSTLLVSFFATVGFAGILYLVPLFLQEARGASPLASGLTTFPEAIGVVVSTQLVARLYPRVGPRRLMAGGLLGVAVGMVLLSLVDLETNAWTIRAVMFLIGGGMAYIFLPNQAASLATITREATGRASTISSVQRQVGAAGGVAALSIVLAAIGPTHAGGAPNLAAYHAAFLAAAGFALIGAFFALRVPDRDAVGTMGRRGEGVGDSPPLQVETESYADETLPGLGTKALTVAESSRERRESAKV